MRPVSSGSPGRGSSRRSRMHTAPQGASAGSWQMSSLCAGETVLGPAERETARRSGMDAEAGRPRPDPGVLTRKCLFVGDPLSSQQATKGAALRSSSLACRWLAPRSIWPTTNPSRRVKRRVGATSSQEQVSRSAKYEPRQLNLVACRSLTGACKWCLGRS